MAFDHLTYRARAIDYLGESLNSGSLVLFLGAGTSAGAGLPNWRRLIETMRTAKKLSNAGIASSADSLQRAADEIRRKFYDGDDRGFAEFVRSCLYRRVKLDQELVRDPLLIALGALMAGSRRGSVRRIVTFNFDCILEWYISLYGLVPSVILQPPADEGAEDVRIYHPHGFLPHPQLKIKGSDFVILDQRSVNLRLGKPADDWLALLRHVLLSGVGLFVGLSEDSFRDRALAPLLTAVGESVKKKRPTGFWILQNGKAKERRREKAVDQEFLGCNVVPLRVSGLEEIPKLLMEICRKSSKAIRVSA